MIFDILAIVIDLDTRRSRMSISESLKESLSLNTPNKAINKLEAYVSLSDFGSNKLQGARSHGAN